MPQFMDEQRRLDVLRRYSILDTPPEEVFDRVARMAASHFKTPIGTVTFVDEARQWFKAIHGLEVRETGRDIAFCSHAIRSDKPMVVPDATMDARFTDNPLVTGSLNIRFYAGAPLITTEGFRLGTVSVIDTVPHPEATQDDCRYLTDLAAIVVHELEMRLAASDVRSDVQRRIEADRRLQRSVAHAPIVLANLDRNLRYTWIINPPPPLKPDDFIGRQDRDLWPAHIAEPDMAVKRAVLDTGEARRTELTVNIGGQRRHYDVVVEPLREDDKVVGIACSAMEVTAWKTAEMALARMEARYRAVIDTAVDAMVMIDENGVIEHFNRAAERIFGYRSDEAVGQNVSILMSEPLRSEHQDYITNYLTTGQAKIIGIGREVTGRRKDGSLVPLDLSIAEWRDGEKRAFTGIMRDITQRKRAEAALSKAEAERAESLALLNAILEGIPDPLFFKDKEGRYVVANSAASAALGAETVIGKTDHDLMPAERARILREGDLKVMAAGEPSIVEEMVGPGTERTSRWFLATKAPLYDESGEVIGIVGFARDITERRAMIEELKLAKNHAEAANRAKTSFLAAASHDLRQPVQALLLFATVLQRKLGGHPAAAILGQMKQSLDALQTLLESLLDISKLDAGVVTVSRQPCSLRSIAARLTQEYGSVARRKGLRLRSVGCGHWTISDPTHLERVLRNLIENALRYTEKGGVLIGCRRRGGRLLLQVIDSGVGIPEDQVASVFQEFVQLGNPERDRTKGLGLGLSIVRRLLDLLGHELRVQSTPGRGTCFTIELSRVEGPGAGIDNVQTELPDEAGRSVLVIDDELMVRQGLELLLGSWKHRVATAADAEEAVNQVSRHGAPDVVLADYRLQGGRTGSEAVEAVRRACGSLVPAIILTGDTAPERIAEVQRSGYLIAHKPVSPESLQKLIYAATGNDRPNAP